MRIPLPFRRRVRTSLSLAVWLGSVMGAWWLYHQGIGSSGVVAMAESKQHRVAPRQLGRLTSLEVVEGQRVSPGQVLARFDTEILEKELSVASAQLRRDSSEVAAAGGTLQAGLLQAERNFRGEIEAADIELGAVRAEQAREVAELAALRSEIERERRLVRQGLSRADRVAPLELRQTTLEEAVRNWPARVEAVTRRRDAAVARQAEWLRTHAEGVASERTQLQPVRERVRQQQESIRLLEAQLGHTVLRAPAEGYVSVILARPGDVLAAGVPVLTLVEADPRQVVAYLEERHGAPAPPGTRVEARRRVGTRERLPGKVVSVAGDVSELPRRMWTNPAVPAWGRAVYIALDGEARLDPGELVDVALGGTAPVSPVQAASVRH
jgi:multidrug resistance efflux pump